MLAGTGVVHLDPDTAMNPHTWQAALRWPVPVPGGRPGDERRKSKTPLRRAPARPPCRKANPMGFCFFNNIRAVAAMHAIKAHGLERVGHHRFRRAPRQRHRGLLAGDDRC